MSNAKAANSAEAIAQLKNKLGIGDDKVYAAMGIFSTPDELVAAGKKIYAMGYRRLDAMSPFPVHGIDDALGIPPSKIGWIVIFFAMLGMATAQGLIYYVGVINYPLVIGGKPLFDFTFSIPVTFELTILFTGIATTVAIFALNGLPRLYHPSMNYKNAHRASDDQFILMIESDDPKFEPAKAANDLRSVGAGEVEVVEG
ncbi:MAG: DUF3341 domain-containing protein [Acidobacteriota bacterium]